MTTERFKIHHSPFIREDVVISIVPERLLLPTCSPMEHKEQSLPIFPMNYFDPEESEFQKPLIEYPDRPQTEEEMQKRLDLYGFDDIKYR